MQPEEKSILERVFIDGQVLGVLVGSIISFIFYRSSKNNSKEIQTKIWKKEFDRNQTEPFIEIFRNILLVLNNNAIARAKSDIPQDFLDRLKIELQLVRYFDNYLKKKINDNIYKECLEYNKTIYQNSVEGSKQSSSTQTTEINVIANEGRCEKERREAIEKAISEVVNDIKIVYSQF